MTPAELGAAVEQLAKLIAEVGPTKREAALLMLDASAIAIHELGLRACNGDEALLRRITPPRKDRD